MNRALRVASPPAALVALVVLAGCEIGYGVFRSAKLDGSPDVECVATALATVRDVTRVQHSHKDPNRRSWPHPTDTLDQFTLHDNEIMGVVELAVAYDGNARLNLYYFQLNRRPPQDKIDRARSIMDQVERALTETCPDMRLASPLVERCDRVECQ